MTLESWSMGIVRPVMEGSPQAWLFFVPFIVITTFAVLNLFVGIIVDAMQSQAGTPLGTAEAVTAPPMPTASPPSLGTPKAPARWVQGNTSSKPERRGSPEEASLARGQASPGTEAGDTPWQINLQSASASSAGS